MITKSGVRNCRICHLKSLDLLGLLIILFQRRCWSLQFDQGGNEDDQQAPELPHRGCAGYDACSRLTGVRSRRWRRWRARRRGRGRRRGEGGISEEGISAAAACTSVARTSVA